jgi:hypothetical protein
MTLEHQMRQLLARMTLLSYGSTTAWNSSGSGKAASKPPMNVGVTLADHWAAEWDKRPDQGTVDAARRELDAALVRRTPAEGDDSTFEDWVIEDGEGYALAQVASKFGIAESRVARLRIKRDREVEFGLPARFAPKQDKSRDRVLNLASQGCTLRQIQMQTGVSKSSVQRWLKDAA